MEQAQQDFFPVEKGFDPEGHLLKRAERPELLLLRALATEAVRLQGSLNRLMREQVADRVLAPVSGQLAGLKTGIALVLVHHYGREHDDALGHAERLVGESVMVACDDEPVWPTVRDQAIAMVVAGR